MAYHLYKTEGIVLDERSFGEANKIFYLLTPDLGLVAASAQGIRDLKSKLRYQISKYSLTRVVLVRGKETWKLTGAEGEHRWENIYSNKAKLTVVVKIFTLLRKFIRGEGQQLALYDDLKAALDYLDHFSPLHYNETMLRAWEMVTVLRLLNHLGYVENEVVLMPFIQFDTWSSDILEQAVAARPAITKAINSGIRHSHI
jgi:DNA repair protein RecO